MEIWSSLPRLIEIFLKKNCAETCADAYLDLKCGGAMDRIAQKLPFSFIAKGI